MKTGDIQLIRSNQGLPESPSQESVMFRVEKETDENIFSREKNRKCQDSSNRIKFRINCS